MAKKQKRSEDQPIMKEIKVDIIEAKAKIEPPKVKGARTITNIRG